MRILPAIALLALLALATTGMAGAQTRGGSGGSSSGGGAVQVAAPTATAASGVPTATSQIAVATPTTVAPGVIPGMVTATPNEIPGVATATPTAFAITAVPTVTVGSPPEPSVPVSSPLLPAVLPDARGLLDSSSAAMATATSMRFSGSLDMSMGGPGLSFNMQMPMSGEMVAPDRFHALMDLSALGYSGEVISVGGTTWTRTGDEPWEVADSSSFSTPINIGSISQPPSGDSAQFLLNPTVADAGSSYRLSSDIDMDQAFAAGSASSAAMFSGGMDSNPFAEMSGATGQATFVIDKATLFMQSVEMTVTMPMPDYAAQAGVSGATTPQGTINLHMLFSFSDFNSPAIHVEPPTL